MRYRLVPPGFQIPVWERNFRNSVLGGLPRFGLPPLPGRSPRNEESRKAFPDERLGAGGAGPIARNYSRTQF